MATRGQSKYMPHLRAKAKASVQRGWQRGWAAVSKSDTLLQHEANEAKAKTNAQKGKRGGDCNRTQCQRPHAWWYNKTMQAYYCGDCAGAINESCLTRDHIESFPNKIYVNPPMAAIDEFVEGGFQVLVTTADGTGTAYQLTNTKEEADDALREFYREADLRSDGSAPFHYSELPAKMEALKERIDQMKANQVSVPATEHSVGRDSK